MKYEVYKNGGREKGNDVFSKFTYSPLTPNDYISVI